MGRDKRLAWSARWEWGQTSSCESHDAQLAMHPLRLDGVEARALDWRRKDHDPHPGVPLLDHPVVDGDPGLRPPANVPEALSQTSSSAVFPAARLARHQAGCWVVTPPIGRPSTERGQNASAGLSAAGPSHHRFSVALTHWRSRIAALGIGSHPSVRPTSFRKASWIAARCRPGARPGRGGNRSSRAGSRTIGRARRSRCAGRGGSRSRSPARWPTGTGPRVWSAGRSAPGGATGGRSSRWGLVLGSSSHATHPVLLGQTPGRCLPTGRGCRLGRSNRGWSSGVGNSGDDPGRRTARAVAASDRLPEGRSYAPARTEQSSSSPCSKTSCGPRTTTSPSGSKMITPTSLATVPRLGTVVW